MNFESEVIVCVVSILQLIFYHLSSFTFLYNSQQQVLMSWEAWEEDEDGGWCF